MTTNPFSVGDWADHKSGSLDPRKVVGVGDDWIDLEIDTARTGPVPAENYDRLPPREEA